MMLFSFEIYQINCAWVVVTTPGKVLNITFNRFHLDSNANCSFEFAQVTQILFLINVPSALKE